MYRLILDIPFMHHNKISYGLIVIAKDSHRCLLVQRRHSIAFLYVIRGYYRPSHLPFLLSELTDEERDIILSCIKLSRTYLSKIFATLKLSDDIEHAYLKLKHDGELITHLISYLHNKHEKIDHEGNGKEEMSKKEENIELTWFFPKGRRSHGEEKETPFECAVREFEEEVEVSLPNPVYLSDTPFHYKDRTLHGKCIDSRLWLYVVEKEFPVVEFNDNDEVKSRRWVHINSLHCYIQDITIETLLDVYSELIF